MVCVRKIKKVIVLLLAVSVLCGAFCTNALAAEPIEYNGSSVIVTEIVSGTTIISDQPDLPIPPGKLSRIVALYVVAKECFSGNVSLDDMVTITEDMTGSDNGQIPLKVGEVFALEDLLYLAYMDYSNTALYAAAIHTAGSIESFIAKMNDAALSAGCTNTLFKTVSGYYTEGQVTTPADMVAFIKMAIQNSIFKQVFSAVTYSVPETNMSIGRTIMTENKVRHASGTYGSSYCVGGKQGGHDETGYATVTLSEYTDTEDEEDSDEPKMELIVISAGAASSEDSYADAYNLIEWTFANFSWHTIVYEGEAIEKVPVDMASGSDYVMVGPADDISALIDNSIETTTFERVVTIYPPDEGDMHLAPIERGDVMGELTISHNGVVYGRVPLVANQSVRLKHWAFFKDEFSNSFKHSELKWIVNIIIILIVLYLIYSALFWYMRITKKRKAKLRRKEIIADRKAGRVMITPEKKEEPAEAEQTISDEQKIDEISEHLDETVEVGDMSEPDIAEIADVVSSEEDNNNTERTDNDE